MLDIENQSVVVDASVEPDAREQSVFIITCNPHQVRKYLLSSQFVEPFSVHITSLKNNGF